MNPLNIFLPLVGVYILSLTVLIVSLSYRQLNSVSPITRNKLRLILGSILIVVIPILIWLLSPVIGISIRHIPAIFFLVSFAIIPIPLGLVIARYKVFNIKFLFSRVVLHSLMSLLVGFGYVLLVTGSSLLFVSQSRFNNLLLDGILIFLFALAYNPLLVKAQNLVDTALFRNESLLNQNLEEFKRDISRKPDLNKLVRTLYRSLQHNLSPERLYIFLFDPSNGYFRAQPDQDGEVPSQLSFMASSLFIQKLLDVEEPMLVMEDDSRVDQYPEESSQLRLLEADYLMPIPGQSRLAGFVVLGKATNKEGFNFAELSFLQEICEYMGMPLERELALVNLNRRIDELSVMTRVAREVNVAVNLDDLLDLIYDQTLRVIPFSDMLISLKNSFTRTITRVYVIQNNERRQELEKTPLARGEGLDQFVLFSAEPLREQDYALACRKFNVLAGNARYYAWMGVPLRASDETIGAVSVASRDPSVVFTEEHENILAGIVDQTAGAMVKAQLLVESQSRARQLELLNQMSSQLSSTLSIDDLNHQIMVNAVKLIDCEAGSLLLVDEAQEDLIFANACGPVAEEIIGRRLASGVGLVGKAIRERSTVMVNDVLTEKDWFSEPDVETGFKTRGLLVAPLISQDKVIGALEVINKRDQQPFDKDDQILLSAFAAQAVIAMDNAKLYTLTDQALALRVEELSVMQRIDRELNTSLDLVRAMTITLEWALSQTKADAGMIGMVEGEGVQITAAQGYENTFPNWKDQPLRKDLTGVNRALLGFSSQMLARADLRERDMILPGMEWQLVIPIMREGEAIGLIFMEKKDPTPPAKETSDFLLRLCDHAAIAISNAQLYSAVNQANIAKSDFVSFVSHELKTPMTSIKGYADLLAAEAVGEINEAQGNFLTTIRDNVDRMSTLVSDLADISRIEAGRMKLSFSAASLQAVIDSVITSTKAMFTERSQALNCSFPEDLPAVWADQNRLVQIVTNLITNASKYTPPEGNIQVSAEETVNIWDPKGAPTVIHLQVKDNGIGIPEKDQGKIFQQYFRTEVGKDLAQGTGLGLNICRYLVEMQGGQIWFESQEGQGTIFHVTIPVAGAHLGHKDEETA